MTWRADEALADAIGIDPPMLRAIRTVESNGKPSAVRFEPHVFHRETDDRYRVEVPYTPGEGRAASTVRSETNRAAFTRAYALDPSAAVRSTSWGAYQVLGGALIQLYGSPAAGVAAFDRNPAVVSDELLVAWFSSRPDALAAARVHDFAEFARRYNGPMYYVRGYDRKLADAYNTARRQWEARVRGDLPLLGGLLLASGIAGLVVGGAYLAVRWAR